MAEKYPAIPITTLERLTPAALTYEVCLIFADAIIARATYFMTPPADKDARSAWRRERVELKSSIDWFDQLVVERIALIDAQKAEDS